MRAGKLTETIVIQRQSETVNDYGTVSEGWTDLATLRAQVIQSSTDEFLKSFGTTGETAIVFRIRWKDGLKLSDRIVCAGKSYDLKEIKNLGRRSDIELRCVVTDQ